MTDPTSEFFAELEKRGHDPLLAKASGTVRFDLANRGRTAHWQVTIAKGDLAVSRANGPADCVVRTEKAVFEDVIAGRVNPMAAVLRGAFDIEGDPELVVLLRRLVRRAQL